MSVMALQTTISAGTGGISDLGYIAHGREGGRGVGLYKTTLVDRQLPPDEVDRGHHGRIVRVRPFGPNHFAFGLTRPRSLPLGLIHRWRVCRDPDNAPPNLSSRRSRPCVRDGCVTKTPSDTMSGGVMTVPVSSG
jgi:hypothetical protein